MTTKRVLPSPPPTPRSPYSQLVEAAGLVFLSGQTGEDWETGQIVDGGFEHECRQLLANVGVLLRAAGLDFGDVVRTTVYVVDLDTMPTLNGIYREYFPNAFPARATVEVSRLGIGAQVEIDVIAAR